MRRAPEHRREIGAALYAYGLYSYHRLPVYLLDLTFSLPSLSETFHRSSPNTNPAFGLVESSSREQVLSINIPHLLVN